MTAPWDENVPLHLLHDPIDRQRRYLAWLDAARAKVQVGNATEEERLAIAHHDTTAESFRRRFEQRLIHGEKRPITPMPSMTVANMSPPPLASEFDGVPGYGRKG